MLRRILFQILLLTPYALSLNHSKTHKPFYKYITYNKNIILNLKLSLVSLAFASIKQTKLIIHSHAASRLLFWPNLYHILGEYDFMNL